MLQLLVIFVFVSMLMNCSSFNIVNMKKKSHNYLSMSATDKPEKTYMIPKMKVIGKADLLEKLRDKTLFKKKDLEVVLEAFTSIIKEDVLIGGSDIRIREFGTFKQKKTVARIGRNPKTGEALQISGSTSVSFSASTNLKDKNDD